MKELVEPIRENLKKAEVWLKVKRTSDEHTWRIEFLTGSMINQASMDWYKKEFTRYRNIKDGDAELRNELVFEKDTKQ